jgi:hypothetical protein
MFSHSLGGGFHFCASWVSVHCSFFLGNSAVLIEHWQVDYVLVEIIIFIETVGLLHLQHKKIQIQMEIISWNRGK